jgi:hypothetical protein
MALTIYLKILISIDVLVRNVFRNHFVLHIARTAAEVSPRPKVATPELLLDMRKRPLGGAPFSDHCNSRLIVT